MYRPILHFWFEQIQPAQWWKVDAAFDRLIAQRFADLHARAVCCELFDWRTDPAGRLAEIIVLDQFSRNIYRGEPRAFAADPLALALAQEAVAAKADLALPQQQRVFLYMPYMHSESRRIHEVAERLFGDNGPADNLDFERRHKAIIDRFGRYPHRNHILGRPSTDEEIEFLKQPGSSF
ncbi:MAG: DUF924 family protein [Burkholderiales bacterium]